MLEALWSVEFVSNVQGFGAGVVVLETGRVLGGDNQYLYVGSYKVQNEKLQARLTVTHYAGAASSIFGPAKEFDLEVTGAPAREKIELHGQVVGRPDLKITIRLTRRAELP